MAVGRSAKQTEDRPDWQDLSAKPLEICGQAAVIDALVNSELYDREESCP